MSVWFVIPSKRRPEEAVPVLQRWIEQGYRVLLQRDPGDAISVANIQRPYVGYAEAVNFLVRSVLESKTITDKPEWFVTGGDDILPDPTKTADEIAAECSKYFARRNERKYNFNPCTFGVMQPTGDRWGEQPDAHDYLDARGKCFVCGRGKDCDQHLKGAYIDRVAGSPWIGREFARRMYGGRGPLCEEYFHMGEDEELMQVAIKYGVFWQRPDLTQFHQHWGRPKRGKKYGQASDMPEFLKPANTEESWKRYKEIFERRRAAGWPGSEPIA